MLVQQMVSKNNNSSWRFWVSCALSVRGSTYNDIGVLSLDVRVYPNSQMSTRIALRNTTGWVKAAPCWLAEWESKQNSACSNGPSCLFFFFYSLWGVCVGFWEFPGCRVPSCWFVFSIRKYGRTDDKMLLLNQP